MKGRGIRISIFAIALALAILVGCSHAEKRPDSGRAADSRQCGAFCRRLDACLGSEFGDEAKDQLCELARCESGCRSRVRAAAGYEGAFQFDRRTWKSVCGPIFARRELAHCRDPSARNDLCCAAVCTAVTIAEEGPGRWPTCGK
jgi:hypothetical protein